MSLVNKSGDWTPNYHKILIFSPPKSLKSLRAARIDELVDSNEPAVNDSTEYQGVKEFHMLACIGCNCKIMVFSPFITYHHSSKGNK